MTSALACCRDRDVTGAIQIEVHSPPAASINYSGSWVTRGRGRDHQASLRSQLHFRQPMLTTKPIDMPYLKSQQIVPE